MGRRFPPLPVRCPAIPFHPRWLVLLKEAKARYDQFFNEFGKREPYWQGHLPMFEQAVAQSAVAIPQPPVRLHWYFMEPKSYRFFSIMFADAALPIETVYQP